MFFRFALSRTVSEITANLYFQNFQKCCPVIIDNKCVIWIVFRLALISYGYFFFLNLKQLSNWYALQIIPLWSQFSSVSLYLLRLLSFNFNLDFKWFIFKKSRFGQFCPDICQNLISAIFKYTDCSNQVLDWLQIQRYFLLGMRNRQFINQSEYNTSHEYS